MKKTIKYIIILFVILYFLLTTNCMANSSVGYEIDSYDIKIKVNEDNTFDIEETITANFYEPRSGITRTLKNLNTVKRDDGRVSFNFAKVKNLEISEDYQIKKELDRTVLRIGNGNKNSKGLKTYKISYTYDIGNDPLKNMDEFYFNIIKNDTNTVINNTSFEIIMPKEFNEEYLKLLLIGEKGSQNDDLIYTINDNTINGKYNKILKAGEVINIRIELPEDYFKDNLIVEYIVAISIIVISSIGFLVTVILWAKYGNDEPIKKIKTSVPPKNYNSAELGFFYKGDSTKEDIMTLLIYLANKGYLKIEEYEEEALFVKEKTFRLTKLKEYDGKNEIEKIFFNNLFKFDLKEITEKELIREFYKVLEKVEKKIESEKNIKKIFEDDGKNKGNIVALIGIIVLTLSVAVPMILDAGIYGLVVSIFTIGFEMVGVYCYRLIRDLNFKKKHNIIVALLLALIGGFLIITMATYVIKIHSFILYKIAHIVGIVSYIMIRILKHFMPKRTKFGNEILGEILGFKEYLDNIDENSIKEMIEKNPNYIYDILPYAYVLNESDKLIKIIDDMGIYNQNPEWFISIGEYKLCLLDKFYIRTTDSELTHTKLIEK